MQASATLVLANHRPETLPRASRLMATHDTIILEEPVDERFGAMLVGEMGIDAYLATQEIEYPAFSRRLARILRERHGAGTRLIQCDPFMDVLLAIHERFADGDGPQDLPKDTATQQVYQAEKAATKALLDFYQVSADGGFEAAVAAVESFARADARRFALRDRMRAASLAALLPQTGKTYIEAGPMHYPLWRELRQRLPAGYDLRLEFLMAGVVRRLGHRRHLYGPGDLLTLYYRFHPNGRCRSTRRLAARALIYNKLILKTEVADQVASYPHTRDELTVGAATDRLSLEDCQQLYTLVRRASTARSREIVNRFLGPPQRLP